MRKNAAFGVYFLTLFVIVSIVFDEGWTPNCKKLKNGVYEI